VDVDLFDFDLPPERIALRPASPRDAARMLVLDGSGAGGVTCDRLVSDLPGELRRGDLLVFNDTRVIPAQLEGMRGSRSGDAAQSAPGPRIGATLHKREGPRRWRAFIRNAKRLREGGRIVNLSSSVVGLYQPTYGVYAATKAAVEAMTHVMANELRGRNITVNAVAPGPTATALFLDGKPQAVIDHLTKLAPLERLGQPEDIANTVAFLAGPEGSWINGQILRANGGII